MFKENHMDSDLTPKTNNQQSDENANDIQPDQQDKLNLSRSLEEETEATEKPQINPEDQRVEKKEVYKNSMVQGFVPEHNHGSVDYTSLEYGHVHQCLDVSSPPRILKNGTHVHYSEGYTLFENGHHHYYKAWSGPAIPVGNGMHVHYYDFYTTTDNGHRHHIIGVDMPAPGTK